MADETPFIAAHARPAEIPLSHQRPKEVDLRSNRPELQNVSDVHMEKMRTMDRIALAITTRVGTFGFFLIIFYWTILWLGWNLLAPKNLQFDPPSAFVLWLFISNLIQIFLMPLIMVGQNLQSQGSDLRAQQDFEVNTQARAEIDHILDHLEYQSDVLEQLIRLANQAHPPTAAPN